MEHLRHFTQPVESLSPSTDYLNQLHRLQPNARQALVNNLINTLSVALGPTPPRTLQGLRVAIPEHSILGHWLSVYWKAINRAAFLDWADGLELDLSTLTLQGTRLQAKKYAPDNAQLHTFTLADDSGWQEVAYPILAVTQLIDTGNIGLSYIGNRVEIADRTLPLELSLAFHGYPLPDNSLQVQVIVDELRALNGFPGVDDSGQSKSVIHSELVNQRLDYQQVVSALEEVRTGSQDYDWLQPYRKRLVLRSDSLLAHTMKNATRQLGVIIGTLDLEGGAGPVTSYYYDYEMRAICLAPPSSHNNTRCITPLQTPQWQALERMADTLQSSVYQDETFSVASLLSVYGIQRPTSASELTQLLELLRQWSPPASPYISESARSFTAVYAHRKYLGMLNDRHKMQIALQQACLGKQAADNIDLNRIVDMDPDVFGPALETARQLLLTLTDDPDFIALREAEGIDPASHVLLTVKGHHLSARGLDGRWKQLNAPVLANKRLWELLPPLLIAANNNGGEIRSNGEITLKQALALYEIEAPRNARKALKTARLLAVPLTIKPQAGQYWRALTLSQPSRWTLSQPQNQLILDISRRSLPATYTHVFAYLSEPVLTDKTLADIRAEADFLLIDLLRSSRAQALGEQLSNNVDWHGRDAGDMNTRASRKALVLAALILSLDPTPHAPANPLSSFDLTDNYLWSESLAFVRYNFEVSLPGLSRPSAALAAHLLLSNKSPEFLIRGGPPSLPYMTSQAWVLFKHYVVHTEQELPGSSRQLSFDDFMTLAYLPASASWERFLNHRDAAAPIVDWAVANGVLKKGATYTAIETNQAIKALKDQRERLKKALTIFTAPFTSLRETARQEPQTSTINVRFGNAFAQRLDQLQEGYVEIISYGLSHLSLPRREALEYGQIECFSLSKAGTHGRFATLVYVRYFSDRYFYEFFPLHALILPRRDLEYARVIQAVNEGNALKPHAWKRFNWPAYADGHAPDQSVLPALQPDVMISKLDVTLPASERSEQDERRLRAPQTFNSVRSKALATLIVQRQLLMGSAALRERATHPITLAEAVDGDDPWTPYINHLVPNGNLAGLLA
ncbi:hypothetical protein ACW9I8_13215 [Pseudomonas reactans]